MSWLFIAYRDNTDFHYIILNLRAASMIFWDSTSPLLTTDMRQHYLKATEISQF